MYSLARGKEIRDSKPSVKEPKTINAWLCMCISWGVCVTVYV
jgi:hypothetical protein